MAWSEHEEVVGLEAREEVRNAHRVVNAREAERLLEALDDDAPARGHVVELERARSCDACILHERREGARPRRA